MHVKLDENNNDVNVYQFIRMLTGSRNIAIRTRAQRQPADILNQPYSPPGNRDDEHSELSYYEQVLCNTR